MLRPREEITERFDHLIEQLQQHTETAQPGDVCSSHDDAVPTRPVDPRALRRAHSLAVRLRQKWMRCRNSLLDMPSDDDEPVQPSGFPPRLSLRDEI